MQLNTEMTSSRPYLLRALNEWILDNDCTPHIVVDTTYENVVVPTQYVEANKIVLNISPSAVSQFNITNEFISFSARFSGKSMEIFVPVVAVQALYSKENGQGMIFNEERSNVVATASIEKPQIAQAHPVTVTTNDSEDKSNSVSSSVKNIRRPSLKLVD